jgi:mannose-6-phosphate isomerase-like protein (cupin superfamily)
MLKNLLYGILLVTMTAGISFAQSGATVGVEKTPAKAPVAPYKAEPIIKGGALYFNKEQVEKTFAAAGSFVKDKDKNYQIMAGSRTTPGQAEIHGKDTDIFYVLDGTCTIVTGGTVVDPKTTGPDETRGASITGGESTQLAKGDLIVIPNGTPHWMSQVQGTFQYLVVKVR